MLLGQGVGFLLQALYFVLLARLLGVQEYGVFVGAFSLVGIVMPYSTLGSGTIFMRYVGSGSGNFAMHWGNILLSTSITGCLLALILRLLAPHLVNPASASVVLIVAIGNCIFSQLVATMGQVFQTFEMLRMTALLNLLTNALRTAALGALAIFQPIATAKQWALVSMYVSILAAGIGFLMVLRQFGLPEFRPRMVFKHAPEGLGFSLGGSAQSVYNDVDKTMLSHYGLNQQNGIYTVAYRIVDVATMPITAMDATALPRYFRSAGEGIHRVPLLAFRLAIRALLIGLVVSVGLFAFAPIIPHVVGAGFAESVRALRWLCLLPAARGIHQLTGSAITGMGYQRCRTISQFSAAGLNLVLNFWLIPRYGWEGAAWSSLATDGSLAVVNWLVLSRLRNSSFERHASCAL